MREVRKGALYLPTRFGEILFELLGDGGVDVAVGLGAGDPIRVDR